MVLPFEKQLEVDKLLRLIGSAADRYTADVVHAYARRLPIASIVRVRESVVHKHVRNRAKYACAALRSELNPE